MRIGIIGTGKIGQALAAHLTKADEVVMSITAEALPPWGNR